MSKFEGFKNPLGAGEQLKEQEEAAVKERESQEQKKLEEKTGGLEDLLDSKNDPQPLRAEKKEIPPAERKITEVPESVNLGSLPLNKYQERLDQKRSERDQRIKTRLSNFAGNIGKWTGLSWIKRQALKVPDVPEIAEYGYKRSKQVAEEKVEAGKQYAGKKIEEGKEYIAKEYEVGKEAVVKSAEAIGVKGFDAYIAYRMKKAQIQHKIDKRVWERMKEKGLNPEADEFAEIMDLVDKLRKKGVDFELTA